MPGWRPSTSARSRRATASSSRRPMAWPMCARASRRRLWPPERSALRLQGTTLGYVIAAAIATGEGGLGVVLTPYLRDNGLSVPAIGAFVALYALAGLASRVPGGR